MYVQVALLAAVGHKLPKTRPVTFELYLWFGWFATWENKRIKQVPIWLHKEPSDE